MSGKVYRSDNVYEAAVSRIRRVFSECERVCVSFSGGKDSTALVHLTLAIARELGRTPIDVLFIDWEAQYSATIDHIRRVLDTPDIRPYWVCLPLSTDNGTSVYDPLFLSWDPAREADWVRALPDWPGVITLDSALPFYRFGMTFEEFVPAFADWYGVPAGSAMLVGIRAQESLNRYRAIKRAHKRPYADIPWSTRMTEQTANFYPLYDWAVEDVWTYLGKHHLPYNTLYDRMYLLGKSVYQMRINEPYGPEARKTLDEVQQLEPETWARFVQRVGGANFGQRYAKTALLGYLNQNTPPPGHTWKSFAQFLLDTLPPDTRAHYQRRIDVFVKWFADHRGWEDLLDADDPKLEARKMGGSWRMIARTLLKNDYFCTGLSFSVNKQEYEKREALKAKYKEL